MPKKKSSSSNDALEKLKQKAKERLDAEELVKKALEGERKKLAEQKKELVSLRAREKVGRVTPEARQRGLEKAAKTRRRKKINSAQQELARRELAKRKLMAFVLRFHSSYQAGWVHQDICARLEKFSEDVAAGRSPRLMLFMPPRHGKSELASKNFPAWHLGRYPKHEIIACSYAGSLAVSFSRKVRQLIRDPGYKGVFPKTELDKDNQGAENWLTTEGGGYVAAGVGGGITGKGAHVLIIDDPVKNAEDAESETAREAQKDWYASTAYTRLAPGGGVLVIQTRWHDDDLSGWLLRQMEEHDDYADQWEVVEYPAVALQDEKYRDVDEALHPARYDEEALRRIRATVGERVWWALYQQRPVADEGSYFKREWFRYYEKAPQTAEMKVYAAWDLAVSKKERADFTVGLVVGVDVHENIHVLHMERGKWDGMEIVERILDVYETWRPEITGIEASHIQAAIGPFLEKRIAERKLTTFAYEPLPPKNRDKESRARAIQARMQQGKLLFPANATITHLAEEEMLRFPHGVHDDIVDAYAWIGRMLVDLIGVAPAKEERMKSWRDKLARFGLKAHHNSTAMGA